MEQFHSNEYFSIREMRRKEEKELGAAYNKVSLAPIIMMAVSYIISFVYYILTLFIPNITSDTAIEIVNFIAYILALLIPAGVVFLLCRKNGDFPTAAPPKASIFFPTLALSFGVSYLGNYVSNYIAAIASYFGITFTQPDFTAPEGGISFFLYFIQITIGAGLFEELLYRGVVLGALRRHGDKLAILVSAFLFALMHGNFVQMPFAFVLGIFYGYMVCRTGSIIYSVIFHALNNTISVLMTLCLELFGEDIYYNISVCFVVLSLVLGAIGLTSEIIKAKRGAVPPLKKDTGILTTSEKFGRLFRSPVAWVTIIIFGVMALGYIEIGG